MDKEIIEKCTLEVSIEEGIAYYSVLAWAETWDAAVKDYDRDAAFHLKDYLYRKAASHAAQ